MAGETMEPDDSGGEPIGALKELVRQAERLIDMQLKSAQEQDEKTAHLMTTTTGILGVSIAVAGLLAGRDGVHLGLAFVPFAALVIVAMACAGRAYYELNRSYTAQGEPQVRLHVGWDPQELVQACYEDRSVEQVLRDTVHGAKRWYTKNHAYLLRVRENRIAATAWLLAAGFFVAAAFLYAAMAATV